MWEYILYGLGVYLLAMNIAAFAAMGTDKRRAKLDRWRTPESTLLLLCFLGGGIGGLLGMKLFRHKTKHMKFLILVPLSVLLWLAAAVYIVVSFLL